MIVESGYDSSSGKEECNEFVLHEYTNLCRCWLSRGLCVAGKPNEIYRKRGIWKLQKIDTNSIENVEERSLIRHSRTLVLPEKYRLHETPWNVQFSYENREFLKDRMQSRKWCWLENLRIYLNVDVKTCMQIASLCSYQIHRNC